MIKPPQNNKTDPATAKQPLGETLPLRITEQTDTRLSLSARKTGLNKSTVMRMAINHGLPLVEAGKLAPAL